MDRERFSEPFGGDPSPFADKPPERKEVGSLKGLSRREILKGLGVIAGTFAGEEALARSWQAFVEPEAHADKGMWELDFEKVKEFDQALNDEVQDRLKKTAGKGKNLDTEAVIASVHQAIKGGVEKSLQALIVSDLKTHAVSGEEFGDRLMAGGLLGVLALPVSEKLAKVLPGEPEPLKPLEGTRRNFFTSLLSTIGGGIGVASTLWDRHLAAKGFDPKEYHEAVKAISYRAELLLADRLAGGKADYKPKAADEDRVAEYEAVVRVAINPKNPFCNPKVLPSHLERFAAAYLLAERLSAHEKS